MTTSLLPGTVTGAPIGALGCDTLKQLTADDVKALAVIGFKFCVRYVNLPHLARPALTRAEAQAILSGGLALMVVQRGRSGWVTASQGTSDGYFAAQCCTAVGLPARVNVWLDLESIDGALFDYANAWHAQVEGAGYTPGIYVGAGIKDHGSAVTGEQLYSHFKASHYWQSQSSVPFVGDRGYQMIQLFPDTQCPLGVDLGFDLDVDVTQHDRKGGTVQWLAPPCVAAAAQHA